MTKEFKDLVDMQETVCAEFADKPAFGTKVNGEYQWTTYAEFGKRVDTCRGALALMDVKRGEKVAIIADNREEWATAAYATYSLGAHYVPMYESQLAKDWEYILNDSSSVVLFAATQSIYDQTVGFIGKIPSLRTVVCLNADENLDYSWASWMKRGASNPTPSAEIDPQEVAGLIYTSGTTGNPKGVILSHDNFISNVNSVNLVFPRVDDVSCAFLPWAHSFGQTAELHCMLSAGCAIGIAESAATLLDDFALVRPTVLFAVPRIFNKIYDGLQKRMAAESPVKRFMFNKAIDVANQRRALSLEGKQSGWLDFQHNILDKLVFSKVRDRFGGRLKYSFSGGAALQKDVGEFIDNVGIDVYEGYGLTETSPIATVNNPEARKFGTIGRAIPGVEVYICDEDGKPLPIDTDGEIVVVGPNVMQGYHKLDDQTAEVIFDLNGKRAFRTGDMGRMDSDGFVKITGRIKEQYKLENGKYVVPAPLEEQIQLSGYINQAFIFGDNRLFNVALIVPDMPACEAWLAENGETASSPEEIAANAKLHAFLGTEIEKFSADFKGYEKPKKWALIPEEFTVANDMLTPKMSVKRRVVIKNYQGVIDGLYK